MSAAVTDSLGSLSAKLKAGTLTVEELMAGFAQTAFVMSTESKTRQGDIRKTVQDDLEKSAKTLSGYLTTMETDGSSGLNTINQGLLNYLTNSQISVPSALRSSLENTKNALDPVLQGIHSQAKIYSSLKDELTKGVAAYSNKAENAIRVLRTLSKTRIDWANNYLDRQAAVVNANYTSKVKGRNPRNSPETSEG
jgi:hypothetical protein